MMTEHVGNGSTRRSADGGPLDGVRILDLTANMSGPFATMILGDQGADVIKVEPLTGDVIRGVGTSSHGMSAYFANLNRSKRSLALDVRNPGSRPILDGLLDRSDVVVTNFRPGVASSLCVDAASVRQTRRALVHAEILGFGARGPFARWPAYDHVIQALSGFAGIQEDRKTGRRSLVRHGVVDKATGQMAAQAICAALVGRARSGEGAAIQISMLDVAVSFLWPDGMMNHTIENPESVLPPIVRTFRLTDTRDGQIAFVVVTREQWSRLLGATGIGDDPALDAPAERARRGGELLRQVGRVLSALTTDEAVERLSEADVPVAPVLGLEDLAGHPQVRANETIAHFDHAWLGPVHQANPAVRFGGDDASQLRSAPVLGEHTAEVLRELDYAVEDIQSLVREGVVALADRAADAAPS